MTVLFGTFEEHDANASDFPIGNYLGNLHYTNITSKEHTMVHGLQYYCNYCTWTKIYSLNYEVVQEHDYDVSEQVISLWYDADTHSEEYVVMLLCDCGYGSCSTKIRTENHYSSGWIWYDAGHSGSQHYYTADCEKSNCGVRFLWRTINCPGGDYHIAPNSLPSIPVVTE